MSILSSNIKVLIAHDGNLTSRNNFPETAFLTNNIDIVGIENSMSNLTGRWQILKPDILLFYVENSTNLAAVLKLSYPTIIILTNSSDVRKSLHGNDKIIIVKPDISSDSSLQKFAVSVSLKIKSLYNTFKTPLSAATKVIAIGASTGGTEAILEVIKDLPSNTCAILIVQHMPEVFSSMYADRLDSLISMRVREAKDNDRVVNGEILIAAGGFHLTLCKDLSGYFVRSATSEKVCGHCPSVDVLFNSVAEVAKSNALGIILTGMGKDGACGLLNMRKAGAYTIGQNAETCIVYGMPNAAKNINAVIKELPLELIASEIINYTNKN